MSDLNNKHLPSDIDSLTRKDLVEIYHIQVAEHQSLIQESNQLKTRALAAESACKKLYADKQNLKQRIEQLEQSNTHEALRVMLQKANAKIEQLEREQAKRDIKQQIKGVNHIGAMLTDMGFDGVESLCEKAIAQLRKGVE